MHILVIGGTGVISSGSAFPIPVRSLPLRLLFSIEDCTKSVTEEIPEF